MPCHAIVRRDRIPARIVAIELQPLALREQVRALARPPLELGVDTRETRTRRRRDVVGALQGRGPEFEGEARLGDEIGDLRPDQVHAEDRAALGVAEDLAESLRLPSDVFSIKNSQSPIVFLRIRSLSAVERNLVSLNSLRDVIVPLSSWIDGALKIPVFTLLEDGELTEKGASGIHSRFIFGPAEGEPQTLDQSVLLSPDRNTLYVLVARCSKTCFEQNQEVLDKIVASFRVQG